MADGSGGLVEFDFAIRNDKTVPVDIFLIDRRTLAEDFRRTVPPGASVAMRSVETDTWVARIGGQKVACYSVYGPSSRWRLYEDSLEKLPECTFAIENRRLETVDIFRMGRDDRRSFMERRVNAGEIIVQESYEGERWVARVGDEEIAAYRVTSRVPRWAITNAVTGFVPALPIGANSHLNEAPATEYPLYQMAVGEVKAAMVFVEFPDARRTDTVDNVAAHIIGAAPAWYATESYGRLKFTVEALGGWRMMPASAITYNAIKTDWAAHRDYISTALKLVPAAETDFDKYNIAYVVAAKTPAGVLDNSPTLSAGIEVPTNRGTVHHAVTFGSDSYDRSYNVLLHETGHLMGLPDLYTFGTPYPDLMRPAGAWDIMCHLDLGRHFLGWHKYKLGWLDESQLPYVKSGEISALLHPFDSSYGIKLIAVAGQSASQLYVIEIAQPLGAGGEWKDKGILIYTVDAAVPTGNDPVRVVSGPDHAPTPDETEAYGILSNAFLGPGRSQTFDLSDGTKIEVVNEAQRGARFAVRVRRA